MTQTQLQRWPARYELLDGLRGIACLGVLLHHLGVTTLGHYAVMIFFVISGYCITASARASLRRGASFSSFMMRRVRRIYPPYLLAVLFFVATRIVKNALTDVGDWNPSLLDWVQNVTLTQWLSLPFYPIDWPSDNPKLFVAAFWSLNYEEQFYLVTGLALLLAQRLGIELSRTVLVLFAIAVVWNLTWPGGWVTGIFIEYWAHFALGSAVYFLLCEFPTVRARIWFSAVTSTLAVYCVIGVLLAAEPSERQQRAYVELILLSTFALGLLALRPLSGAISRSVLWKPIAALGVVSYSLYLVHQFNLTLVERAVGFLPTQLPSVALTTAKVVVHVGIAAAFWYVCERPFLSKRASSAGDEGELPKQVALNLRT